MSLTSTDIQRLAHLSRLSFDPPASQRLLAGLNDFFAIVEQMREVDTSGVVPMAHPIDAMPHVRIDIGLERRAVEVTRGGKAGGGRHHEPAKRSRRHIGNLIRAPRTGIHSPRDRRRHRPANQRPIS